MTEELEQLLKNLKLRRILEIYDEQVRAADKDDISYSDFVTRLVRAQYQAKQEGALEWRIQRALLPERWTLETFPFARQPGVNRKQIRGFAELEFIAKAENIVLVGETGRGKTGLACGLLLKALENGYRCQFVKAQNLFDEMYASLADRSTRQLLKRLARLDVLLIDELGYLNLKPEQSNIFFKLMEDATASIPPSSPRTSYMTSGRTFWAAGRWWKRCSAGYGITVTPCTSKVHRCATRKVEEYDHERRPRPGRIYSPGAGSVSQNAGYGGNRPPSGPSGGRAALPTRRLGKRDRKRIRAGGDAPPDAARRCSAVGHDSFAGLFPSRDRGSARPAHQPALLPISPPQARTGHADTVGHRVLRHQLPMRALGADDGKPNRTPAAWMKLLAPPTPTQRTRLRRG